CSRLAPEAPATVSDRRMLEGPADGIQPGDSRAPGGMHSRGGPGAYRSTLSRCRGAGALTTVGRSGMNRDLPGWIYGALSLPRLAPYLRAANGDSGVAMRLYWWNIEVSGAFYGPLHCLEVGLRNALHERLKEHLGRAEWWAAAPLTAAGSRMVADVVDKVRNRGAVHVSADDVVAGLSFGFWVALLSRGAAYDRSFWVPALHKAFPGYSGSRARLHEGLLTMVLLRNRIMHHE